MTERLSSRRSVILIAGCAAFFTASRAFSRPDGELALPVTTITAEDIRQTGKSLDVLSLINAARQDPAAFADRVGASRMGSGSARSEAVDFLRGTTPRPTLTYDPSLATAARLHARDIGASGATSHTGSDGSTPGQRIQSVLGAIPVMTAEELSFGQRTALDSVLQLILDENVTGRPHRRDLFSTAFTHAGVGCAKHHVHRDTCVIVLSTRPPGSGFQLNLPPPKSPCPDLKAEFPDYEDYCRDLEWFEARRVSLGVRMTQASDGYRAAEASGDTARRDGFARQMSELDVESDHLHQLSKQWKAETAELTGRLRARINDLPPECRGLYRIA